MPRALTTRRVFHIDGRPISWVYFWREVWKPALEVAGLEYRAPYNLRHSYAWHSLQAGVPIASLARLMGHADVSRTFQVYGGWSNQQAEDAARRTRQRAHSSSRPTATRPGPAPSPPSHADRAALSSCGTS